MTAWAALFVVAAGVTVLRDDVNTIPPGEWRYEKFSIGPKLPSDLDCEFKPDRPEKVRVELLTAENLQARLKGKEYESIATSSSGSLHQEIGVPGNFALVIENLDHVNAARVAMRATVDTTGLSLVKARYLTPERKLVVIVTSFVGFLLIVTLSASKLLRAMKR